MRWLMVLAALGAALSVSASETRELAAALAIPVGGDACVGHERYDDGTIEGAAGYSNSTTNGIYTMAFNPIPGRATRITEVCVCLTRTANATASTLPFNVVVHGPSDGARPGPLYGTRAAVAQDVPIFDAVGASYYKVDFAANPIVVPPGASFVGIQWVPFDNREFFLCADTSPENAFQPTWSSSSGGQNWESMAVIRPSLRAFGIRAKREGVVIEQIPVLGPIGLVTLLLAIGVMGLRRAQR
jgi:hypothetical protein